MIPNLIERLEQRLRGELPGLDAQTKMLSIRSYSPGYLEDYEIPDNHKTAAVMVLVYQKDGVWHTALMQRPPSPYPHSRQVSFPGGGQENDDPSLEFTALRETEEEFGIDREKIEVINKLTPLYIEVSNYLVHPFVGHIKEAPRFVPEEAEVAEILEIPLIHLLDSNRRKRTDIKLPSSDTVLKNVPYFDLAQRNVWGATAMMLSEFVAILESIN
ncbi:MAG: CoA pyrophosphatase [Saprospiraceae bacterium]|nr:CoA pyrophosphatase [Saprospiraceae bacterium]